MKKRPKHEEGTCGYEVLRPRKSDGIYMPVKLKDSRGHCPGDPMCRYTVLGRIQARVDQLPAMRRAKAMLQQRGVPAKMLDDEYLYELVCSVKSIEPVATVEGYGWPYSKDALGGNADYIDWRNHE